MSAADRDRKPENAPRSRLDLIAELLCGALEHDVEESVDASLTPAEEPRASASGGSRR